MKKSFGSKTLLGPCPVFCVATYDKAGRPNVMAVSWGGICCSNPPAVTVSLRKATYSYGNIMESGAYTISVPSKDFIDEADFFGTVSGRDVDKFKATGLTPVKSEIVNAPYIAEFPLIIECKVIHTYEIGLHTQFIGEILDVKTDEDVLDKNGNIEMLKVNPFFYDVGQRQYYQSENYIQKAYKKHSFK